MFSTSMEHEIVTLFDVFGRWYFALSVVFILTGFFGREGSATCPRLFSVLNILIALQIHPCVGTSRLADVPYINQTAGNILCA